MFKSSSDYSNPNRFMLSADRNPERMSAVVDFLFTRPIFFIRQVSDGLGIPLKTARAYIEKLVQRGYLQEITGYARNRIYQADEIFKAVQGFDFE